MLLSETIYAGDSMNQQLKQTRIALWKLINRVIQTGVRNVVVVPLFSVRALAGQGESGRALKLENMAAPLSKGSTRAP
jgi:hypothetical protein